MKPESEERRWKRLRVVLYGVAALIGMAAVANVASTLGSSSAEPLPMEIPSSKPISPRPSHTPKVRLRPSVTDPSFETPSTDASTVDAK